MGVETGQGYLGRLAITLGVRGIGCSFFKKDVYNSFQVLR